MANLLILIVASLGAAAGPGTSSQGSGTTAQIGIGLEPCNNIFTVSADFSSPTVLSRTLVDSDLKTANSLDLNNVVAGDLALLSARVECFQFVALLADVTIDVVPAMRLLQKSVLGKYTVQRTPTVFRSVTLNADGSLAIPTLYVQRVTNDPIVGGFTMVLHEPPFTTEDCCDDPCLNNPDPCCGNSDPCCGDEDPCCGDPDPECCAECGDGNPCTIDICLPGGGCKYEAKCPPDDDPCTIDYCDENGACHADPKCDDGLECTTDTCDPDTGECTNEWPCAEPVDPCFERVCEGANCVIQPKDCDDGNECTNDSCDPDTGACIHAWPCAEPSDPCKQRFCIDGECVIEDRDCDDNNDCTNDYCDPVQGCIHDDICSDDNECTNDLCIDGACAYEWFCEDHDKCTDDWCDGNGVCHYDPVICDDGDACTNDTCNPATGGCIFDQMVCDDENECTDDSCDSQTGDCEFVTITEPRPGCDCGESDPGPCNDEDDPGCGDSDCCTQNTCEIQNGGPVCVVEPAPAGHYPDGCGTYQPGLCNACDDDGCGDSDCCTEYDCECDGFGNAQCVYYPHSSCAGFACDAGLGNDTACRGDAFAFFDYYIQNTGEFQTTFDWWVTKDSGVVDVTSLPSGSVTLSPGAFHFGTLSVGLAPDSPVGTAVLSLHVAACGEEYCSDPGTLTLIAPTCSAVLGSGVGCPGDSLLIPCFIQNDGTCAAQYDWSVTQVFGTVQLLNIPLNGTVYLEPGEFVNAPIVVGINANSPSGTAILELMVTVAGVETCWYLNVVTVVSPDIGIDSDNDGTVAAADDPIEEDAPGKFIAVNHSDDDDDDQLDANDADGVAADPDVQPMPIGSTICAGGERWRISYPATRVRVHDAHFGGMANVAANGIWAACPIPSSFWIEGLTPSAAPGDVSVVFELDLDGNGTVDCSDTVVATVVRVDLDVDSDNTKGCGDFTPDRTDEEDVIETDDPDDPGRFVAVNDDFDEGHTVLEPCLLPLDGCDRVPDNNDAAPVTADGSALETSDFVILVGEILSDSDPILSGAVITLNVAGGTGQVRVVAVRPGATAPFADDWVIVPFGANLRDDYFNMAGQYKGWTWYAEGMVPGDVELELEFKQNNTSLVDRIELAVTRIEVIRMNGVETPLEDWPEVPSINLLRSARFPFDTDDRVLIRVTSAPGLGNGYFSVNVTSDSDGVGIEVLLNETGAGQYVNDAAEALGLDETSSAGAPKTIQIIDEEILTLDFRLEATDVQVFCDRGTMVDRAEGAAGGIQVFYGSATGDQAPLQAEMWGNTNMFHNGDLNAPHSLAGSAALRAFIKNAGDSNPNSLEADLLWISAHGCQGGTLSNNDAVFSTVIDPDGPGGMAPGDWNSDIEWVAIAACLWLNEGVPCTGVVLPGHCAGIPTPPWGRQAWQGVSYNSPRSIHGLLGAWCQLAGNLQVNVTDFFQRLRAASPYVTAYQNAMEAAGANIQPWAVLYVVQLEYHLETLFEHRPDMSGPNLPPLTYAHLAGTPANVCGRSGSRAPGNGDSDQANLAELANLPDTYSAETLVTPIAPVVDPGFTHRVYSKANGLIEYASDKQYFTEGAATTLSKEQAEALADQWLATHLPKQESTFLHRGTGHVEIIEVDRNAGNETQTTVGYLVDYAQTVNGLPLQNHYVRIRIIGDSIAASIIKIVDVVKPVASELRAERLSAQVAYDGVVARVKARLGVTAGITIVEADLRYWTGQSISQAVPLDKPVTAMLTYRFVVGKGDCKNGGSCARDLHEVMVDAVTGELKGLQRK